MSKTRKWMLVLLSVCFLFSLAFGIAVNGFAEGETEIELPDQLVAADWSGNTELRIPSNLKSLNQAQLTYDASMLDKVKITSGDKTYACSHIYEWNGELTFYFNGSGYTGTTPAEGDVLSIAAGLTVTDKEGTTYIVSEDISWTCNGTQWTRDGAVAEGTEITLPDQLVAADWSGNTELRIPSNLKSLNQAQLTYDASMLSKVKITSGDKTYACSHIYEWNGELTFYFNGSGYTGTTPAEGDVLSIAAGLTVTNKEGTTYVVSKDVSWEFDGTQWVKDGAQLPQEPTAADANLVSVADNGGGNASFPIRVDVTTDITAALLGNSATLTTDDLAKVTYTRGNESVTPSVAQGNGKEMYFYFKSSDTLTLVEDTPETGDVFEIAEGFTFLSLDKTYKYTLKGELRYIYDGNQFVVDLTGYEEIFVNSITTTDVVNNQNTDTPFFVNTSSSNKADFGDANYTQTNICNYITFTFPSGTVVSPWYCRVNGSVARFFIHKESGTGNINNGEIPVGSVMTIKAGFRILETEAVKADVSYVFNGTEWLEGTELEDVDVEYKNATTAVSPFASNFPMRVDVATTAENLGGGNVDLQGTAQESGDSKTLVTYTRGDATVSCGAAHANGSVINFYFKNPTGVTFETGVSVAGDKLTIGAGFTFTDAQGGLRYINKEAVVFVFDGAIWAPEGATTAVIQFPSSIAASDWNGKTEVRIPSNLENLNQTQLSYDASMLSLVKLMRGDTTYACSHIYEWGGKITFYFNGSNYSGGQAGDKLIISAGLQVTNKNNIVYYTAEDVTYTCDGVGWTKDRVMPDRDYENLTTITIESVTTSDLIGGETDSVFFINTTSTNTQDFGDDNYENTYTILPYLSFVYPDGKIGDVWCVRVNGRVARLFIHEPGSQTNLNANTIPEGGVLTIKAGFGILNTEAVKEDVSFVYNGTAFVPLVEPDDFTIATANNTEIKVGESLKIEVTDAENVTAYYRFSVSDTSIATVNALGVVTGMAEGTVTVSVWYGDLEAKTIDLVVTPITAEDIREFAIVDTIETFRIPVSTAENPTSLWNTVVVEGGFVLKAEYTLENGVVVTVDITEEEIEEVDYSAPGSYTITIKDDLSGLQDTVNVIVYDYTAVGAWDSIGVSGYDVNDERNAGGTWNGHMMIGMNSYSTNTYNMTGGISNDVLSEMAGYVVYTRADGTTYQNTEEDKPISLWELSSNILVMIRPEGYTGTMGYGVHKETNTPIPIYNQGDTIQFKKGMPIYLYVCNSAKTEGYFVVEGYLEEDYTYYCYSDNGTSSLWQLYIEYTDFTVNETIELGVNSTAQIGAVRVPADATTGTFSYESSDTSVVTINASGNMVGMKVGTATITITLEGGKDEEGNLLDPIVKVVTVNVTRSVASVSGTGTIVVGTEFDASKYEVTITYTDGTSETMKLNAEGVVLQAVDTSAVGEQTYNVMVTVDGTSVRGTFVLTVTEKSSGCKSIVNGTSLWGIAVLLLGAAAMIVVARKRTVKK